MCFPYKIELEIEGDLPEALMIDMFNNMKESFKSGMCFDAIKKLQTQYMNGIEKHKKLKHSGKKKRK